MVESSWKLNFIYSFFPLGNVYLIVTQWLYNYQHHTTGGMFGLMGGSSSWHFSHQSFYLLLIPFVSFPSTGFIKHAWWEADCSEILRWGWRGLRQRSRGSGGRVWDSGGTRRTTHPDLGAPARPLWAVLCRHLGCLLLCHKGGQGQKEGFVLQVALQSGAVHAV